MKEDGVNFMKKHEKAFLLLKGCNCENCVSYNKSFDFERVEGPAFTISSKIGCSNKAMKKLLKSNEQFAPLSLTGICDYYNEK